MKHSSGDAGDDETGGDAIVLVDCTVAILDDKQ